MGPFEWLLDNLPGSGVVPELNVDDFIFVEDFGGVRIVSDDGVAPSEAPKLAAWRTADQVKTDLSNGAVWIVAGVALFFAVRAVVKG